jgi:hypothetical protein
MLQMVNYILCHFRDAICKVSSLTRIQHRLRRLDDVASEWPHLNSDEIILA